jgi:PAP2 superfamily/Vanadium chloroperoxidase N-terminal domain
MPRHPHRPEIESLEDRSLPSGDMVLRWNAIALDAVRNDYATGKPVDQGGPTMDSRALAIVSIAVADALDTVDHSFEPYLVRAHARPGTSGDAAVACAAHDTLVALYPHQQARIDAAFRASLNHVAHDGGSARGMRLGIRVGRSIAARMMADRAQDGSKIDAPYTFGTAPGQWQADPLHPQQTPLGADWGAVTPFVLRSGTQFRVPPPPPMSGRQYARAFHEVKAFGGDGVHTPTRRTPRQTRIAIFWGYDGTIGLGTPPVLYNEITRTLARQEHNTEVENARLFALVNTAMADTAIATWEAKYADDFWRPVTAIRAADSDGNPRTAADPAWTPLGAPADNGSGTNFTPAFPAYPSGHAGFGGALFRILADFYGTDHIRFTIGSDEFNGHTRDQNGNVRPVVRFHFTSFSQAAEQNGQSRIYLGIHWQFDKVQGIKLGTEIADFVFHRLMRPA